MILYLYASVKPLVAKTQKDSQKEKKSTSRFADMAQNDHDPLMPRCDDTLDSWLSRTSANEPSDPDLLPGLDEDFIEWLSRLVASQTSRWTLQMSAHEGRFVDPIHRGSG